MDREINLMHDLCETVKKELEMLNEKTKRSGGEMSSGDIEHLRNLTESMENLKCIIAKLEEKEGYSGAYYGYGGMDMESGRRRRSRDSMSRTMARGNSMRSMDYAGYTRDDAMEDFMRELETLVNRAPDEYSRMKFERFLNEMR